MNFIFDKYQNNQDHFRKFFLDNIQRTYGVYSERLVLVKNEFNEENVHDIRVSIRRLVIILDLASLFFPAHNILKLRKKLKSQFDKLSKLRDTQVMSLSILQMQVEYPQLISFLSFLRLEENEMIKKNKFFFAKIDSKKTDNLITNLAWTFRSEPLLSDLNFSSAFDFLNKRSDEIIDAKTNLKELDFNQLHNFRIKLKKYRYLVEALRDLIPDSRSLLKNLAAEQGKLGKIQDLEVLCNTFAKFIAKNPDSVLSADKILAKVNDMKRLFASEFLAV